MSKLLEILSNMIKAYKERRLIRKLKSRLRPYLLGLKFVLNDPASSNIVLHSPRYIEPSKDRDEIEVVERIFHSFKKMKDDQHKKSKLYHPSTLWQQQMDISYSYIHDALQSNDLNKFHFFLSNFGSWKEDHGLEGNILIRNNMKTLIGRRYLKNVIFNENLKNWRWIYNNRKPVSRLTYPTYGNQAGAYIEDKFVGPGSFFNEIYGSILSGLIDDVDRPIVADLGAGYGKLGYFAMREFQNSCFIDFDLPEPLCLASYYLMKTWPDKKTLLYGEQEYTENSHKHYELIFMPSYEIENVGKNSINLFINKNSLGEMTREAANNYIQYITNSTRYFFHMNHDVFPEVYTDNSRGPLGYEFPVPKDDFKLLFRYPDVGHVLNHGNFNYYMDIFIYLYEKRQRFG